MIVRAVPATYIRQQKCLRVFKCKVRWGEPFKCSARSRSARPCGCSGKRIPAETCKKVFLVSFFFFLDAGVKIKGLICLFSVMHWLRRVTHSTCLPLWAKQWKDLCVCARPFTDCSCMCTHTQRWYRRRDKNVQKIASEKWRLLPKDA